MQQGQSHPSCSSVAGGDQDAGRPVIDPVHAERLDERIARRVLPQRTPRPTRRLELFDAGTERWIARPEGELSGTIARVDAAPRAICECEIDVRRDIDR